MHGNGTETQSDGEKYVGEFKDGLYHGQGTYTYANGGKYVGEFKDDNKHGQGTYTYADGAIYVGEWKDNEKHEGMQVKIKRLSERYVVKTRLHPDFDVKPTKEGKKNGKNRRRNKKNSNDGKFDPSATI